MSGAGGRTQHVDGTWKRVSRRERRPFQTNQEQTWQVCASSYPSSMAATTSRAHVNNLLITEGSAERSV